MKKSRIFLLNSIFVISFVYILMSFMSCENFLKGKEFSEKLQETIQYASSESVVLDYSETYGSIRIKQFDGNIKITDVYEIEFSENSNYGFVKWQLYDKSSKAFLSDKEAAEIIKFENLTSPSTSIEILSLRENLVIYPKCNKRPKISSYSPMYDPKGTYKNQQIVVNFDTAMDEDSIYFSKEELEFISYDEVFKSNYAGKENKIYAYMDSNGDVHFKNITITLLNQTQFKKANDNLASCFQEPYFDESKRVLHYKKNITDMIDAGSKILVSVNKNMFTTIDGKKVTLAEEKTWDYYTNGLNRQTGPEFAKLEIYSTSTKSGAYSGSDKDNAELKKTSYFSNIKYDTDFLTDISYSSFVKDGNVEFYVNSLIFDEDYDIKEVKLIFSPLEHSYYEASYKEQEPLVYTLNNETNYSKYPNGAYVDNISSGKPLSIPSENLKEGVYSVYLQAVNENEESGKSESFVFLYDETPAHINVNDESVTNYGAATWKMRTENYYDYYLNYTIDSDKTIKKLELEYQFLPEDTSIDGYSYEVSSTQEIVLKNIFAEDDYEREFLTNSLTYYRKSDPYTPNLLFRYKVTDIYGHIWHSDFVYLVPTDSNWNEGTKSYMGQIHYLRENNGSLEEYYSRDKEQYSF